MRFEIFCDAFLRLGKISLQNGAILCNAAASLKIAERSNVSNTAQNGENVRKTPFLDHESLALTGY